MDNPEVMKPQEEAVKNDGKSGKIVHIVAAIVIFIIATVLCAVTVVFNVDMHIVFITTEGLERLALIVLIPVSIFFGFVTTILGVVGVVLSSTVWRYREGRDRVFGIVSTVLNSVYILLAILMPMIILLINSAG